MTFVHNTHDEPTIILNKDRLKALRNTYLLDTKAEAAFDRLTRLSTKVLGAPVSLVSLVDADRQFFKSAAGLDLKETPLSHSFCQHVVSTGKPLVVNDARQHPLVSNNKAIDDLGVVGYLGMPIHTSSGFNIGSLCVIDHEPRQWTQDEIEILQDLTNSVMMEIEMRVQMLMEKEVGQSLSTTDFYGDVPKIAQQFGIYQVVKNIGSGGMADVYQCEHQMLGTQVAVKHLRPNQKHYEQFLARFKQEARIISQLKHPNIVRVFDYGMEEEKAYMVMEYIQGETLTAYLEHKGQLSLDDEHDIFIDLAQALDYAHSQGIVHRDVKPDNVMLRHRLQNGRPMNRYHATLMDFGIAKIVSSNNNLTAGDLLGTVNYVAPEQIQEATAVDHRADIYSFGLMAYQMLTGTHPFASDSVGTVIKNHLVGQAPDPRTYAPYLTDQQVSALQIALAKDPADRYTTATDFVRALLAGTSVSI